MARPAVRPCVVVVSTVCCHGPLISIGRGSSFIISLLLLFGFDLMLPAVEKDSRLAWGSFPIDAIPYSRDPNGRLDRDKHNLYCCRCSYYCRFVFWAFIFYFPSIRNHIELVFFLSFFLDRHHHHHLRGRAAVCWTRITHTSISQQQQLAVAVIYNPKWVDSYYILNCYWLADWLMVLRYLGNWQRTVSHATLMYNTFFFFFFFFFFSWISSSSSLHLSFSHKTHAVPQSLCWQAP